MGLTIEGAPPLGPDAPPRIANTLVTSPGYFETVGMTMASGRAFTSADDANSPRVVITNEAAAKYFGDRNPIGQHLATGFDGSTPVRAVVGVVRDVHDRGVGKEPIPTVYIPFSNSRSCMARSQFALASRPQRSSVPSVRRFRDSTRAFRSATSRRSALVYHSPWESRDSIHSSPPHARPWRSLSSPSLRALLFQVEPVDAPSLIGAAAFVAAVTLLASVIPARRASLVSPTAALRYE